MTDFRADHSVLEQKLRDTLGAAYTIDHRIPGGGMSVAFAGTEAAFGRHIVVKVLPHELATGEAAARFRAEVALVAALHHPQIVAVLDHGTVDGLPYFIMPAVVGESLRERLKRGPLSIRETASILIDVCRALVHAHSHGVVHRDIKPDNILLTATSAVVADFGVAKATERAERALSAGTSTPVRPDTREGASSGTPAYMAPEQVAGDPATDFRADLYALGVVAYEMLVGAAPFVGQPASVMAAHLTESPPPPSLRRGEIPPRLETLILQCLAKAPEQRPRSGLDLMRALQDPATLLPGSQSRTARARQRPPSPSAGRNALHRVVLGSAQTWQDARHSLAALRANPGFTALAVLTIALGIGAATAIFSVVDATLLRPLPFREPDRLSAVFLRMPVQYGTGAIDMVWSYPKYQAFAASQTVFSDLAVHTPDQFVIGFADGAEHVTGESVGSTYFSLLGVAPQRGRLLDGARDDAAGGERVVVLSDGYWRSRFGGTDDIVGATLRINGNPFIVAGVAPRGFAGISGNARLWVLFTANRTEGILRGATTHQFQLLGRLAPHAAHGSAATAVRTIGAELDAQYPDRGSGHWSADAYPLDRLRVDPAVRRTVVALGAAVAILLLLASVNLVNLLLARSAARRRELAVRLAVGATGSRIVRQLVTENVVLVAIGAAAGIAVAFTAARLLAQFAPVAAANLSSVRGNMTALVLGGIGIDARAVMFCLAVALCVAVGTALVPSIAATRISLADAMRPAVGAVSVSRFGARSVSPHTALVVTQIALAVVLLVCSGLTLRSLGALLSASRVGYDPSNVLTGRLYFGALRYPADSTATVRELIRERLTALPGVTDVAIGTCAPVGDHCEGTSISVGDDQTDAHVSFHVVSPGYFRTLHVPVLRGREFTSDDRRSTARVMVINETAARSIWGARDPLTTPLRYGGTVVQVVGIVGDVRYEDVETPAKPAVFSPYAQTGRTGGMLLLRTSAEPGTLAAAVRREIAAIDVGIAFADIATLGARVGQATARSRFAVGVMGTFAAMALALAGIGTYGVLALGVAQRRKEFGLRLALGATRRTVLRQVMSHALVLAAIGAAIGGAAALAAARAIRAVLYGVGTFDALTFAACGGLVFLTVLLAALLPSLRAMQASPMLVLRGE